MIRRHWITLLAATALVAVATFGSLDGAAQPPTTGTATPYAYDPPPSRWINAEKVWARSALQERQYDVLVVPFQVGGHALDAVARALMTRSLVNRIANGSNLSVADPTLVEKALGSGARTVLQTEVFELAESINAQLIVLGVVGHDRQNAYNLRVETIPLDNGRVQLVSRRTVATFMQIPFSDLDLPYFSFLERRDELAEAIVGELAPAERETGEFTADMPGLPASLDEMKATAAGSVLDAIHYLQFLGALYTGSAEHRPQERMFERSLVLLEGLAEDSPTYRLLRARALLYLHRRPAALAALGVPQTPEERALRAYLDGHLPDMAQNVSAIEAPLLRLIAQVELERMRSAYDRTTSLETLEQVVKPEDDWAPLIYQSVAAANPWRQYTHVPVKVALDIHLPIPRFELGAFLAAKAALADEVSEYDVAQLAVRHIDALLSERYADWLADDSAPMGPFEGDVVDLARDMLVASVSDQANHLRGRVGDRERAYVVIRAYDALFADHPTLTMLKGWIEFGLSGERPEPESSILKDSGYEYLRRGVVWSEGQNDFTQEVLLVPRQFFPGSEKLTADEFARRFYYSDWPNRADWGWRSGSGPERTERLKHCVAYTRTRFSCVMQLHDQLKRFGEDSEDAAPKLLEETAHRFVGHPRRVDFLSDVTRTAGDDDAAHALLREAIEGGSEDWEPYLQLGIGLAQLGRANEARDIFLRYPGFESQTLSDRVRLSNRAYDAGSALYWAGEYEAARPLYEISAGYQTGSAAGITSRVRLALMDGDYATAAIESARRAQRYGERYAFRDYIGLLHLLGESETAWAVLGGLHSELGQPEIWIGAFVGHRVENASVAEIIDWAFQADRAALSTSRGSLALRYVFMTQVIDREIDASLPERLRELDPEPPIRDSRGRVVMGSAAVLPSRHFGDQSNQPAIPDVPVGEIDNLLVMVTRGLQALEAHNYVAAFEAFDTASRTYDLNEFFPYYAWAAVKAGQTTRIATYLTNSMAEKERIGRLARPSMGRYFDEYLAYAYLHGGQGEHEQAIEYLTRANADILHTTDRRVFTRYQIIEAAERLFEDSGQREYRDFALELARRNAIIEPIHAWTHAFVAKLASDDIERRYARARALYLDPRSKRANDASPDEVAAARRLAESGFQHELAAHSTL